MSNRDHQLFATSLYDSLILLSQGKEPTGPAREHDRHLRAVTGDTFGTPANSLLLPLGEMARAVRALSVGSFTGAGSLVETDDANISPVLRAAAVVGRAGCQFRTGLTGNLPIPREVTAATFGWYHETDTVTESTPTTGQAALAPCRCSAALSLSSQLDVQSGSLASQFFLQSMVAGAMSAIDNAALQGSGVAGQPAGIYSQAEAIPITFSGAPNLSKVLSMEKQIATNNAVDANICFVGHPSTRERWRSIQALTGSGKALWSLNEDKVLSHPAFVSTNMPATGIIAGDFSQMLVGIWGKDAPIQLLVDKYSLSMTGRVRIIATILAGATLIHGNNFIYNADSAVA